MSINKITDEEFQRLAIEKQHEELILIMKKISNILDRSTDTELEMAVNKLNNHIDKLVVSGLNVNIEGLNKTLQKLSETKEIVKQKDPDEIEQWTFHVNRNQAGYIESVTAMKF